MPILYQTDLEQQARAGNVSSPGAFFYLMNLTNIDMRVEKIVQNSEEILDQTIYNKYIILDVNDMPNVLIGLPGLGNGDIVQYNTNFAWELYKDVSNSKTDNGLVYDKRTKKYYQYDSVNGWKPILRSGAIDGGTFS